MTGEWIVVNSEKAHYVGSNRGGIEIGIGKPGKEDWPDDAVWITLTQKECLAFIKRLLVAHDGATTLAKILRHPSVPHGEPGRFTHVVDTPDL